MPTTRAHEPYFVQWCEGLLLGDEPPSICGAGEVRAIFNFPRLALLLLSTKNSCYNGTKVKSARVK
jgi:hypothetical protein